eukprot:COSAG05_NODE_14650_length_391_cov_0.866438_1_plen_122_part_10
MQYTSLLGLSGSLIQAVSSIAGVDQSQLSQGDVETLTPDCAGVPGGNSTADACDPPVCDANPTNDNSTCADCNGVANGNAVADHCGTCDSNGANDCARDCAQVWGGSAVFGHPCPNICGGNG